MPTSSDKLKTHYKLNDRIQVKVIEQIDKKFWIVSLRGTLIRVLNSSGHDLNEGDIIWMKLISLDPPQLGWDE